MALIKCKECGKEVSSEAPTCPGCGTPIKLRPRPKQRSVFVIVVQVLISLFIIFVILPILFCGGLYKLGDYRVKQRVAEQKQKQDETNLRILKIEEALEIYKEKNGRYPNSVEGLEAITPYLDNSPIIDAWNNDFIYWGPADSYYYTLSRYSLTSKGGDGVIGTDDDIVSRGEN